MNSSLTKILRRMERLQAMNYLIEQKPQLSGYNHPVTYIQDTLNYIKKNDPSFTIKRKLREIENLSPTLVSLILKKKRKITTKRAHLFSKLLDLGPREAFLFENWIQKLDQSELSSSTFEDSQEKMEAVESSSDWLAIYVKEAFKVKGLQENPEALFEVFKDITEKERLQSVIDSLLLSNELQKDVDGRIFVNSSLEKIYSYKNENESKVLQNLFKASLENIKLKMENQSASDNQTSTLMIQSLDEKGFYDIKKMILELHNKVQEYKVVQENPSDNLYQIYLNITKLTDY